MRTIAANSNATEAPVTIADIVSRRPCAFFFKHDYLKIILPLLQEEIHGAAGVVDDEGRLCGLLTERAVLRHIFKCSADPLISSTNFRKYIDDMLVSDAMIEKPETLDDDIPISEAAGMMLRRGYRYMPVVSRYDRNQFLGIVSERELALALQRQLEETQKAERSHRSLLSYMLAEPYCNASSPDGG